MRPPPLRKATLAVILQSVSNCFFAEGLAGANAKQKFALPIVHAGRQRKVHVAQIVLSLVPGRGTSASPENTLAACKNLHRKKMPSMEVGNLGAH